MPLPSFAELFDRADRQSTRTPTVAAGGADPTVIAALNIASKRGWVDPILAGDRSEIERVADSAGESLEDFRILDVPSNPSAAAVREVRSGRARILMKGQVATPELMKAVLDGALGLRTGHVVGQIVLMEIARDDRRFLLTDTGVTIAPTLEQKEDLLRSLRATAVALGCQKPRIAVMSATEKPTPAMPDTLEAEDLARRGSEGAFGDCVVQGPLSFDLAYSTTAAERKHIEGNVVGGADAMLFPNLLAANLTVKGIMYAADCRFGGVLCGTGCPIVFMSRADDVATRLHSLALALAVEGATSPSGKSRS